MISFIAKQFGGKLKLNERADLKYLDKAELLSLDWAEADADCKRIIKSMTCGKYESLSFNGRD